MKLITLIDKYIVYRKSFGEQMKVNAECLKLFSRTMGKNISISNISAKKVKDFLYNNRPVTSRWFSKYYALLGFYRYAISRGYANDCPLQNNLPKTPPHFIPYIYTREELRKIFKSALTYKNKNRGHLDPYMVRILLILLYSTGLRLNEALSLTMQDVDMDNKIIKVREAKFYKTRLVPFGIQLSTVLEEYLRWRKKHKNYNHPESRFFITLKGGRVKFQIIEYIFRRIRKMANIQRTDNPSYQPRIHDLRHTFAVHRLTSWYEEQQDVQNLLPVLSTYLGHGRLAATSVYLIMTNDLLREAGIRFEKYLIGGY